MRLLCLLINSRRDENDDRAVADDIPALSFSQQSLQIDTYAIFNGDSYRKHDMHSLSGTTRKIEFKDNFQIKADYTNLALCRRACSPFLLRPAVVCKSLYIYRLWYARRVRTYASVRIDCTLPVNWCSKILAIPEHKMQGISLGGWYVAGKIGGISDQCHDVWYGY